MDRLIKLPKLECCSRCGGDHFEITFKRLLVPINEYLYFSICPHTEEPILMKVKIDNQP